MKKTILLVLLLSLSVFAFAQWQINEGFESSSLPTGWQTHDEGDAMTWLCLNNPSHAHSGSYAAFCDDYLPHQNSDWLITPALNITQGDSLFFYTRSWVSDENLKVYLSTNGTNTSNFTHLLSNIQNISTNYQRVALSLNDYVGQSVYIGFFWQCSNYGILVDDVKIGKPVIVQPALVLPDSFSFVQGESLTVDFTPYITCTSMNTASLAVTGNIHTNIVINNQMVTFSCAEWNGTENVTFTLTDNTSGLQATNSVPVIINPVPTSDIALTNIMIPRETEYVSHQIYPQVRISNQGNCVHLTPIDVNCIITDSQNQVAYNQTCTYVPSIDPDSTAIVSFSQNWVPNTIGTYKALFNLVNSDENLVNDTISCVFNIVVREMTGGPDDFGYRWIDSNADGGPAYIWNDISATGQSAIMHNVPTFAGDDNFCEPIDFGFDFPFYGSTYSHFYVDING